MNVGTNRITRVPWLRLWTEPLVQLNPAFEPGHSIDQLVQEDVLHLLIPPGGA